MLGAGGSKASRRQSMSLLTAPLRVMTKHNSVSIGNTDEMVGDNVSGATSLMSTKAGGAVRVAPLRLPNQGSKVDSPRGLGAARDGVAVGQAPMNNLNQRGTAAAGLVSTASMGAQRVMRPVAAAAAAVAAGLGGGGMDGAQNGGGIHKTRNALRVQHHGHDVMPMMSMGEDGYEEEEKEGVGEGGPRQQQSPVMVLWSTSWWDSILRELHADTTSSTTWARRLKCFEDMTERIREYVEVGGGGTVDPGMDAAQEACMVKVLQVVSEHVSIAHYKVAQAAMETLQQLVLSRSPVVVSHITIFFPRIFSRLGDPKEQIKSLANVMLDQCREIYDPSVLCTAVIRSLSADQITDKARQGMLEFLQAIIPQASLHLSNPSHLRGLLCKLGSLWLARVPIPVQRALASCLLAVFHLDSDAFLKQLLELSNNHQTAIKQALQNTVSDLDARLRSVSTLATTSSQRKSAKVGMARRTQPPSKSKQQLRVGGEEGPTDGSMTGAAGVCSLEDTTPDNIASYRTDRAHTQESTPTGNDHASTRVEPGRCGVDHINSQEEEERNQVPVLKDLRPRPLDAWPEVVALPRRQPQEDHDLSENGTANGGQPPSGLSREVVSRVIVVLGDANEKSYNKSRAIKELAGLLTQGEREVWDQYFGQVLHVLLEGIRAEGEGEVLNPECQGQHQCGPLLLRETEPSPEDQDQVALSRNVRFISLQGLRLLLKHRPEQMASFLEVVVGRLLECANDYCYQVYHYAERALENLVTCVDPDKYYQVLLSFLCVGRLPFPRLLMALRALVKLVPKVSSPVLQSSLGSLGPLLVQEMSSPEIFMRLTVVCLLAEVYFVIGDGLFPYTQSLRAPQLKLLTIYISKQRENIRLSGHRSHGELTEEGCMSLADGFRDS